jgi:hypothetical protein
MSMHRTSLETRVVAIMVAIMVDRRGLVLLAVAAIIGVDVGVPPHGNYWMEYGGCRFVLQRHRESRGVHAAVPYLMNLG